MPDATGAVSSSSTRVPLDGTLERHTIPYEPSDLQRFLVNRAKKKVNFGNRHGYRWALERVWYETILFYRGHQWVQYDNTARRLVDAKLPRWFPKPVDNQIYPRANRLAAQFLKRRPDARVRPNSNSADDRQAATYAEYLLGHVDDVVQEDMKRQQAAYSVTLTGHVVSKEWFNPNAGPEIELPQIDMQTSPVTQDVAWCGTCGEDYDPQTVGQPCPTCAPAGVQTPLTPQQRQVTLPDGSPATQAQPMPKLGPDGQPLPPLKFHQGEIESEILLPFEFYVDENADTLERAEWCAHVTYRDLEWVDRNFPQVSQYVAEESGVAVASFYRSALLHIVAAASRFEAFSGGEQLRGGAIVIDYEERPTPDFPTGLRLIVIGDVLAYAGPLPLGMEFSYSDLRYDLIPGHFWGVTPIEQLLPLQRSINSIRSQLIINRKTILNPWILAPEGCGLVPGNVLLRPAAVVTYTWNAMGTTPQIVPGTPLPEQIIQEWKMALDSMDRIAATEESSSGVAPTGVKSGVALAQLNEAAETTHQPRTLRWESFIASRGRKRLLLAQQFYREARLVKTLGAGSVYEVRKLKGADLLGNTDVTVEAGSSLPRSRMAQLQLVFDMLQAQVLDINEPGMREKVLDEAGLVGIMPALSEDRRRAIAENAAMDSGVLPMQAAPFSPMLSSVGKYDNNPAHLLEHLAEVKDPAFDQKPPQVQQLYLAHIQQHRFAEMLIMQLQLSTAGGAPAAADAGGAEPEGGGGGGEQAPGAPEKPGAVAKSPDAVQGTDRQAA